MTCSWQYIFNVCVMTMLITGCTPLEFTGSEPYQTTKLNIARPKIALVLSGGGSRGIAHIGVLKALEEMNIKPDLIIGSSVGAFVGALYAHNGFLDDVTMLVQKKFFEFVNYSAYAWPFSLTNFDKMELFLKDIFKETSFENLKIPLIVMATNLEFGHSTEFSSGPLIDPILASMSVPGFFEPIKIHGQYFVDGGVSNNLAVDVAQNFNPNIIIASNINPSLSTCAPNHMFGLMARSLQIALKTQASRNCKNADYCINLDTKNIGLFDDTHNEYLFQMGYDKAYQVLKPLRQNPIQDSD